MEVADTHNSTEVASDMAVAVSFHDFELWLSLTLKPFKQDTTEAVAMDTRVDTTEAVDTENKRTHAHLRINKTNWKSK